MFESINDQFEEITSLLSEKDELGRIDTIDTHILQILINFLKKFREASDCLEASKYPTLHLVILWYKILMAHCQVNDFDDENLAHIKFIVRQKMIDKFKIDDLHKLAIFFNPRMKQLKILETSDVNLVKTQIKELCMQVNDESDNSFDTIQERSSKRPRNESFIEFNQYLDSSSEDDEEDEVDKYLKCKISKDNNLDILQWWKDNKNNLQIFVLITFPFQLQVQQVRENLVLQVKLLMNAAQI